MKLYVACILNVTNIYFNVDDHSSAFLPLNFFVRLDGLILKTGFSLYCTLEDDKILVTNVRYTS